MIKNRIKKLIELMDKNSIDAYIIPSSDDHQSEYVANHFKAREFISGFSGSAGTICILRNGEHGLWTDGRYYLQASIELENTGIKLHKLGMPEVKNYDKWLIDNLKSNSVIGCNGKVFSIEQIEKLKIAGKLKDIKIKTDLDLISKIWDDRPKKPLDDIFKHDIEFSGISVEEKIADVRKKLISNNANVTIISTLDDIAWLFNLRGNDVDYNPVFLSYAAVTMDESYLFIDENKCSKEVKSYLESKNIILKSYDEISNWIKSLNNKNIVISKSKFNYSLYDLIDSTNEVIYSRNLTTDLKAIKNKVEIKNMKNCFKRDGVAMVKFMMWLEEEVPKGNVTEVIAQDKLSYFRSQQEYFKDDSFGYISGYSSNGAIIHYSAKEENCKSLKEKGFYLIDSGGQYLDGTTDITRTIALGELSKKQKEDYTLVLKGHINMASAKFLEGTYGSNLDILARKPLWEYGFNYNHGTGHGVGYFLNVHEGPQRIARKPSNIILKPGMVLSNEPGIYRKGEYGIRLENLVLVSLENKTDFGQFMKFEDLTICPFDLDAIDISILSEKDINWINNYHERVYNTLSSYLSEDEQIWLKEKTKAI